MKESNNRLMGWSLLLSEYDFKVEYRPGRVHSNADALSRIKPIRLLIQSE